jgi:hypothetical protein
VSDTITFPAISRDRFDWLIAQGAGYVGAGMGMYAMHSAVRDAIETTRMYRDNDFRNQMEEACGTSLSEYEWRRFVRSKAFIDARDTLPHPDAIETMRLIGAPVMTYALGSAVLGGAVAMIISTSAERLEKWGGYVSVGLLFTLGVMSKAKILDPISHSFASVTPSMGSHAICQAMRSYAESVASRDLRGSSDPARRSFAGAVDADEPPPAGVGSVADGDASDRAECASLIDGAEVGVAVWGMSPAGVAPAFVGASSAIR